MSVHDGDPHLALSENRADLSEKLRDLRQTDFPGLREKLAPAASVNRFQERVPRPVVIDKPRFDHQCCWSEEWRELSVHPALRNRGSRLEAYRNIGI